MSLNILILEPFLGGSHKDFVNGLKSYSTHNIVSLTMSDKHWKWRMTGGAVSLAKEVTHLKTKFDLIFASSLTNLSAFIALTNPRFASTPTVLYMHENKLTEPLMEGEKRDDTFCYLNYLSTLVADHVVFNSQFHLDSFFEALPLFLKNFPDHQNSETIDQIRGKSRVIHPGIHLSHFDAQPDTRSSNKRPVIVWNQRWTTDKNPESFFRVMNRLDDAGFEFDLILAGDNRHDKPEAFELAWKRYGQRIIHYGYVDNVESYSKLLHKGDIVVSTASYEYFCLAILEAIYCGCHPLLPNNLTYPELIPASLQKPLLHASILYESEDELFVILRSILTEEVKALPKASLKSINTHFDWSKKIEDFDSLFEEVTIRID